MAFLIGSTAPELQRLLVPFTCALIGFLAYGSQWLFAHSPDLAPGPLTRAESWTFNTLVACTWWSYYKAITVDPGRYEFPSALLRELRKSRRGGGNNNNNNNNNKGADGGEDEEDLDEEAWERQQRGVGGIGVRARWCRKCAAPKPARAHHCKTCGRCVPRMDHHCPWTANCVSLQTFPYFLRFLFWAFLALATLLLHLSRRFCRGLWDARHLPAYLGPPPAHLALLAALGLGAVAATFFVGVLLVTTLKAWIFNTTMIESWEIERHEAVLERLPGYGGAGTGGGEDGDDGSWWRTRGDGTTTADDGPPPEPVEFPYDVGIFANMAQAMGTRNPLLWALPIFAGGPRVAQPSGSETSLAELNGSGWRYEENGLNDREGMWPPLDPEKARHARLWRRRRRELREAQKWYPNDDAGEEGGGEDAREAFRRRQERDLMRWRHRSGPAGIMDELEEVDGAGGYHAYPYASRGRGTGGWANADGEKLGDYGVDDEDEDEDDDDDEAGFDVPTPSSSSNDDDEVPLAELIRRRKVRTNDGEDT